MTRGQTYSGLVIQNGNPDCWLSGWVSTLSMDITAIQKPAITTSPSFAPNHLCFNNCLILQTDLRFHCGSMIVGDDYICRSGTVQCRLIFLKPNVKPAVDWHVCSQPYWDFWHDLKLCSALEMRCIYPSGSTRKEHRNRSRHPKEPLVFNRHYQTIWDMSSEPAQSSKRRCVSTACVACRKRKSKVRILLNSQPPHY